MQLFSIGLFELNIDGTRKVDPSTGEDMPTYTNEDIMDHARVWTGYAYEDIRGNIGDQQGQGGAINLIDPMKLDAKKRDKFPKMTLDKNYLGDVYPLCSELPKQSFLRKGSKFRFHGPVSSYGELHDIYEKDADTTKTHFTPDEQSSGLYKALCGPKSGGKCTFPSAVTLKEDLVCVGDVECGADTIRSIKMVDGDSVVFYTYVDPPCVYLSFFDDGQVQNNRYNLQCADPSIVTAAGFACCRSRETLDALCPEGSGFVDNSWSAVRGDQCVPIGGWRWTCPEGCTETADRKWPKCLLAGTEARCTLSDAIADGGDACHYIAESLTFDSARERCAAVVDGGDVCRLHRDQVGTADFQSTNWASTCAGFQYTWTDQKCALQVQVYPTGRVSIVENKVNWYFKEYSGNEFRVAWAEDGAGVQRNGQAAKFPTFAGNCTAGCIPMPSFGGSCLCDVTVDEEAVFTNAAALLPTAVELRAALHIGAHPPHHFGTGPAGYTLCTTAACTSQPGIKAYTRGTLASPAAFDADTIFEIVDAKLADEAHGRPTRKHAKYLLNRVSTVHVGRDEEYIVLEGGTTCAEQGLLDVDERSCMFAARQALIRAGIGDFVSTRQSGLELVLGYDDVGNTWGSNAMGPGCHTAPGEEYKTYFNRGIGKPTADFRAICRKELGSSGGDGGSTATQTTGFSFRNAPHFVQGLGSYDYAVGASGKSTGGGNALMPYGDGDHLEAMCHHETEALIDHLFEHDNTAPFIAYRLIQRTVSSNPSPRYVAAVATAFTTGEHDGKTYTGEYGDLGAAAAAMLLDREARSSLVEVDGAHGSLREPLLKVTHMMRAMEYSSKYSREIDMSSVYKYIGQRAFSNPSVFNFYLPEFTPDGGIADAGLVSPESQIATAPLVVGYLNGISSLINNGLTSCDRGFGSANAGPGGVRNCNFPEGDDGRLQFEPFDPSDPTSVVDELDLLLTAGRLHPMTRQVMVDAYAEYAGLVRLDLNGVGATVTHSYEKKWPNGDDYEFGSAASLIDGEITVESNKLIGSFCVKTGSHSTTGNGFEINLGQEYDIVSIILHARADCCGSAVHTVYLDGTMCSEQVTLKTKSQTVAKGCSGLASTIKIFDPRTDNKFQLCEVEVLVREKPDANGKYPTMMPENHGPALKRLQKLFAIAPEYHATNDNAVVEEQREKAPEQISTGETLKGVVVVFLTGGADSYNMLVPHSGCTKPVDGEGSDDGGGGDRRMVRERRAAAQREPHNLYGEYQDVRGADFALPLNVLRQVDVSPADGQPCTKFGLHPKLKVLQELYQQGDAILLSNVGVLVEPIADEEDYRSGDKVIPPGVFAHNSMQKGVRTVHAENADAKGVLGRLVKHMQEGATAMKSKLYSFSGYSRMLDGALSPDIIDPKEGVVRFTEYGDLAADIHSISGSKSGSLFAESYAAKLSASLASTEYLGVTLENTTLESDCTNEGADQSTCIAFPTTVLGSQLLEAAKVIHLDSTSFATERAAYYTELGGFDTHDTTDIDDLMEQLNDAIDAFHKQMVHEGVWDDIAIVIASDFGRTLTTNSQGTDHAWGGNYFLLGGKVKGGKMIGKYPTRLAEGVNPLNLGRGRMLPTTPWESVWNAVSGWWGVDSKEDREALLPHTKNFPDDAIFQKADIFQN